MTMHTPYDERIRTHALAAGLDPVLVQALVVTESKGQPYAHRVEPSYLANRLVQQQAEAWSRKWHGTPTSYTERTDRASSWGLGQLLGQTAREHGFAAQYLPELAEVEVNLAWVCRVLAAWQRRAQSPHHLLAMWNGGPGTPYPQMRDDVRGYVAKVGDFMAESPYADQPAVEDPA
jgi:hypothetical protein